MNRSLFLLVACLVLCAGCDEEYPDIFRDTGTLKPGFVIPDISGKTIDNEDFSWDSLRGKYVLVKLTASWCGPCKREITYMKAAGASKFSGCSVSW